MDAGCDTRMASDERMPEETICGDSLSFSVDGLSKYFYSNSERDCYGWSGT